MKIIFNYLLLYPNNIPLNLNFKVKNRIKVKMEKRNETYFMYF